MILKILKKLEHLVLKWFGNLQIQQQRILKLYSIGGVPEYIANRELKSIYSYMKLTKAIDSFLVLLLAKIQSCSLQR